jgi:hypothetical protein
MRKKPIPVLCAIVVSLSFYSCSDLILPKRVEITGAVNLPVQTGMANFGDILTDMLTEAFSSQKTGDETLSIEVFEVNHDDLEVQTFCIYVPVEMTENLNPNDFLKTINKQLHDGMSTEPKPVEIEIPIPNFFFGNDEIEIPLDIIKIPDIPPIRLDDIARYVIDIDFDVCDGKTVESGIGINFFLEEIIPGLAMKITCKNLNFPEEARPLAKDNIFGNSDALTLELAEYSDRINGKKLEFKMELLSTNNPDNPKMLRLNTSSLTPGVPIKLNGEVRFFQNWKHTHINTETAMKSASTVDKLTGIFPSGNGYFDLSDLKKYTSGGLSFQGIKVKMYMSNSIDIDLGLKLDPQYSGKEGENLLYDGEFSIDDKPLILSDYLNDDGMYTAKSLPHTDDTSDDNNLGTAAIVDIFNTMPNDLTFMYRITLPDILCLTPETFDKSIKDDSKLTTAMMLWLPLSLVTQEGSTIMIPGMFNNVNDLLGRKSPGNFLVKIQNIKMTIELSSPIFSNGSLFIDGENGVDDPKLFFPDGIILGGKKASKKITVNFTKKDLDIVQENLIKPRIWIKFKEGDTINIPKNLGVLGIKFEMKGIQIGEEFFK